MAWATSIGFQHDQRALPRGISKHLHKFGEQDREQGMDLILVASDLRTQLLLQAYQFAVGRYVLGFEHSQSAVHR